MSEDERRTTPRLDQALSLYVEVEERMHPVSDISLGGVCFFSSVPYETGKHIQVSDGDESVLLTAEVLQCQKVPMESTDTGTSWRIRGRFSPPVNEMHLLALVKGRVLAQD